MRGEMERRAGEGKVSFCVISAVLQGLLFKPGKQREAKGKEANEREPSKRVLLPQCKRVGAVQSMLEHGILGSVGVSSSGGSEGLVRDVVIEVTGVGGIVKVRLEGGLHSMDVW
jgi:hypothetical protein